VLDAYATGELGGSSSGSTGSSRGA
jgi:hypothetical protein